MRDDILTPGRVTPFEIMDLLEAFAKLLEGRCPWSSEGIVLKKIITIEQNEWSYRNVYGNTVRSPHKFFRAIASRPPTVGSINLLDLRHWLVAYALLLLTLTSRMLRVSHLWERIFFCNLQPASNSRVVGQAMLRHC